MRDHYYRKGHGFLIVYSVTQKVTFDGVEKFYKQILRVREEPSYPMVLLANKVDLEAKRVVPRQDGVDYAKARGMPYFETSAKTGQNVEEAFCAIVREINARQPKLDDDSDVRHKPKRRCTIL